MVGASAFVIRAWWWPLENLATFRVQTVVVLVVAVMYWSHRKRWWLVGTLALLALPPLMSVAPIYLSPAVSPSATGKAVFRAVLANVRTSNREYSRLASYVRAAPPDVLVLLEVDDGWADALDALRDLYPHRIQRVREDNFGIALLSRLPFMHSRVEQLAPGSGPALVVGVRPKGSEQDLTIIGAHLFPPVSGFGAAQRDLQAASLACLSANSRQHVLVLGDLNMVDSAAAFEALLGAGNLRDTRAGFGIQATWPVQLPFLLIPLDHVLASSRISILNRKLGPAIGSDHYPVEVQIGF